MKKTPTKKTTATTVAGYDATFKGNAKKVCIFVRQEINKALPRSSKVASKIWHGSPVWFIDGNPVVSYTVRKAGDVNVMFFSGQSFKHKGLTKEGSFKAAEVRYATVDDVNVTDLRKWLKESKTVQWDYKNIVKNRGLLRRI